MISLAHELFMSEHYPVTLTKHCSTANYFSMFIDEVRRVPSKSECSTAVPERAKFCAANTLGLTV